LRLAQLEASAQKARSPAQPDSGSVASAYIWEELIVGSSADARSFLEVSCWLPVLTEPLCQAVAEDSTGRPRLTSPDIDALPIAPVASRPGAFRHPPILTRSLQKEYRRRDPLVAIGACRRAAEACRRTGELATAIELYLKADCAEEAAEACADLAAGDEASLSEVVGLLQGLPEHMPVGSPLLAWRVRSLVAAGRVDEARRLLEQADQGATSGNTAGQADSRDLMVARALVAEHLGEVAGLLACADRLLNSVERTGASLRSVSQAHGWRIRAFAWGGDRDRASEALATLDQLGLGATHHTAVNTALVRAWVAWFDGDISATENNVAAAQREISYNGSGSAELALLAGSAHRERNHLATAVPLIEEARTLAARSSHRVVATLAASELARCHRVAGAYMKALELAVSTRAANLELPAAVDAHLRSTEVKVRLDRGDVIGAQTLIRDTPPGADAQLLAARVALQQAPTHARQLLEAIDAPAPRHAVEKALIRAQLSDSEPPEKSAALIEAISVGEPLGLVRTFLDEGPTLTRRLPQLALECTDRTVGRLAALGCQELAQAATREQAMPIQQLTARELAVLRLLPMRMSNREMAAQLYISVNTLKSHVRAIYRKLDVPHRSAAVHRAAALQLV